MPIRSHASRARDQFLPEPNCCALPFVFVTGAHLLALVIVQDWEIDGGGNCTFDVLVGRPYIDHGTLVLENTAVVVYDFIRHVCSQSKPVKVWGRRRGGLL